MSEEKDLEHEIVSAELAEAEDQSTFKTLFFIALNDLDSSIILYHRGLYPQAVFHIQQAVEKAVKSMGLLFGIIEEDKLLKIGHKPLDVYKKTVNRISEDAIELNKNLSEHPEFNGFLDLSGVNFSEFVASVKKGKHEFNEYINTIVGYNLTREELNDYISQIQDLNNQVEEVNKKIDDGEFDDEKFIEMKEAVKSEYGRIISSLTIPEKFKEQMRNGLTEMFDSSFPNKEFFEYIVWFMFNAVAGCWFVLFHLSVITSLHSSKARYPEENFNPLTFYTPDLPLVERLPEIQNITRQTLEKMDEIYDLMINHPDHLIGLSENQYSEAGENPDEQ